MILGVSAIPVVAVQWEQNQTSDKSLFYPLRYIIKLLIAPIFATFVKNHTYYRAMQKENLEDILSRLLADDSSVMKELFQLHYTSACATIFRYIKDRNLVEDLAQNIFIRFWEKRHQLNITTSIGAYLHRMAVNEALGHIRKNKKVTIEEITPMTPIGITEDASESMMYGELKTQITAAIDQLPPKCRAVFQLSRFEELSYKEIAEKLDISVKTVENQIGKALRVLRAQMKGYLR